MKGYTSRLADWELVGHELPPGRSPVGHDTDEAVVLGGADEQLQQQESDARSVQCECCGMAEDCTPGYIGRVRARFEGRWVCGLCSEAVSERRRLEPALTVGEAVESHASLCSSFNRTVRLNPTLSLARSMRDIARTSCLSRRRSARAAARGGAGGAAPKSAGLDCH
ncbi:hypothetical protein ABZP36_024654 [Zizania latifolia]